MLGLSSEKSPHHTDWIDNFLAAFKGQGSSGHFLGESLPTLTIKLIKTLYYSLALGRKYLGRPSFSK
jgi:hypothetical protein